MKISNFFKSKLFLIQIGIAFLATIILVWITLLSLGWYTHHGEELEVPDLYGMNLEDAENKLEESQLRYSIFDSIYDADYAPGAVLDQRPLAGSIVKRKRNVFLTINSLKPEQVRFPNLVDNSFRQAYELLITNGFTIGKLEYAENQFFNLLLYPKHNGDTIFAGSMIDKGATIDLVLGKGNSHRIIAPNLMGKSMSESREKITLSNMNIGSVSYDATIANHLDSLKAKVWRQYPLYNENQKNIPGAKMDIWLTRDSIKLHEADSLFRKRQSELLY